MLCFFENVAHATRLLELYLGRARNAATTSASVWSDFRVASRFDLCELNRVASWVVIIIVIWRAASNEMAGGFCIPLVMLCSIDIAGVGIPMRMDCGVFVGHGFLDWCC